MDSTSPQDRPQQAQEALDTAAAVPPDVQPVLEEAQKMLLGAVQGWGRPKNWVRWRFEIRMLEDAADYDFWVEQAGGDVEHLDPRMITSVVRRLRRWMTGPRGAWFTAVF